jgi:hypothetical protein
MMNLKHFDEDKEKTTFLAAESLIQTKVGFEPTIFELPSIEHIDQVPKSECSHNLFCESPFRAKSFLTNFRPRIMNKGSYEK